MSSFFCYFIREYHWQFLVGHLVSRYCFRLGDTLFNESSSRGRPSRQCSPHNNNGSIPHRNSPRQSSVWWRMRVAVYCHSIAPSIDGVCRRFTSILTELVNEGHEVLLYTLEEDPQDLPPGIQTIWLDYLLMPAYPNKRVAKPELQTLYLIYQSLLSFQPNYIHVTGDGITQLFACIGLLLNIPVLGSFHTDILDLLASHHANQFQLFSLQFKEMVDSFILDSCATTSISFAVCLLI